MKKNCIYIIKEGDQTDLLLFVNRFQITVRFQTNLQNTVIHSFFSSYEDP